MRINQKGLDLIKQFEGLRLHAYQDIVGIWTIGYGSTNPKVSPNDFITEEQANTRLENDIKATEDGVTSMVKVPLTENQFSALVSLAYNIGLGALVKSSLLTTLNSKDYSTAANMFIRYDHADGKEVKSLLDRRIAEKTLFLTLGESFPPSAASTSENNDVDKLINMVDSLT
jgi:lysozyme